MALTIETFSNVKGGNSFYKAISHPLAAKMATAMIDRMAETDALAIYDPFGLYSGFAEFYDLGALTIRHAFVQDIERIGQPVAECRAQPVTELRNAKIDTLLVAAFDPTRLIDHIRHLIPSGVSIVSFDQMRLEDALLTNPRTYLDPLNFATNFAFFRDADVLHTRLVTANYWSGYGAKKVVLHLILFAEDGAVLAEWDETLPDGVASIQIDSSTVRERFGIGPFVGQLYFHAVGIAGHDVVKYALDVWSDDGTELSCTHDANAWPADLYAGLPAPDDGEEIVLWIQNSHPCPIPANSVGLNLMGENDKISWLPEEIPPYGTRRAVVSALLPDAVWPQQLEIQAGKYFVRPRYEITDARERRRIAHANVERTDLKPDPAIAEIGKLMGKGYILPAPILPLDRWRSEVLPTPMATCQEELPITALIVDAAGEEIMRYRFGRLPRNHHDALHIGSMLEEGASLPSGYGHVELIYDFANGDGAGADGWLHGLFRYESKETGHAAETSFGAHIFNTVLTFRTEPQSYVTQPPGLSTRLFLRLGPAPLDTICHLIYPASTPWHGKSRTQIILYHGNGEKTAEHEIAIPCGGSRLWHYSELFDAGDRARAGDAAYIVIRDQTCRLFGYHGLLGPSGAFSLDHMFGF